MPEPQKQSNVDTVVLIGTKLHPMISYNEAKGLAQRYLEENLEGMVYVGEPDAEWEGHWVFPYDSKRYLETKHIEDAIGGNLPVLVNKETGILSTMPPFWKRKEFQEARNKGLIITGEDRVVNQTKRVLKKWFLAGLGVAVLVLSYLLLSN